MLITKRSTSNVNISAHYLITRGQDKTAILNETKPPISKMRQNRRFRKWDKTADLENETKSPILKGDKTADFVEENKLLSKLFLW